MKKSLVLGTQIPSSMNCLPFRDSATAIVANLEIKIPCSLIKSKAAQSFGKQEHVKEGPLTFNAGVFHHGPHPSREYILG